MTTVFDYNITEQEMRQLSIPHKETYLNHTSRGKALTDICQLLNARNMGAMIVELIISLSATMGMTELLATMATTCNPQPTT